MYVRKLYLKASRVKYTTFSFDGDVIFLSKESGQIYSINTSYFNFRRRRNARRVKILVYTIIITSHMYINSM